MIKPIRGLSLAMSYELGAMSFIFDLIYLVIAVIYLPVFIFRRKFHSGFLSRLGFLPKDLALNNPIWIHAVSVGEALSIKSLAEELRKIYPRKKIVFSTVTVTGNKIAKTLTKEGDFLTYLPLDLSFIVRGVIDRINPSLFIIAETEIWPNLIRYLYKKGIPVIVVNGKISDKSYRGYLMIKFLLKAILGKIILFCVQADEDAARLIRLGVSGDRIRVTGNMKFDTTDYPAQQINQGAGSRIVFSKMRMRDTDYKIKLGLRPEEKLFVAGSTHPGEEEIILEVYQKLLSEFSNLRLLIAPRHPDRTKEIEKIVVKYGFSSFKISQLNEPTNQRTNEPTIFILDTIGELISYYAIADIVFVAGSLVRKIGGHNILEPAALVKPVLFGPYSFKSADIVELFLRERAAIMVRNPEELRAELVYLLRNPGKMVELGKRAQELILTNRGATAKNIAGIRSLFDDGD